MRMGALTYEPDLTIQPDEEVWFAQTCGETLRDGQDFIHPGCNEPTR